MDDIRHKLQTKPTRFLDQLRLHIRQQGLAYKTEQTYDHWVKRFIYWWCFEGSTLPSLCHFTGHI
jgi:hypothetical protein